MSSETPRTDEQRPQNMGVNRDFARALERELNEFKQAAFVFTDCDPVEPHHITVTMNAWLKRIETAERELAAATETIGNQRERIRYLEGAK